MAIVPFKAAMAQVLKEPTVKQALAAARNLSKRGAKKQFKKKKARPGDLSRGGQKPGSKGPLRPDSKTFKKEEDLLFGKGQKTRRGRKIRRQKGY